VTETLPEPQITKKRVTMRTAEIVPGMTDDAGKPVVKITEGVDYVREDFLDAYLVDARSRWQTVEVSEEYDAGPAGYDGATYVPPGIAHPLAHHFYPATGCKNCDHAPVDAEGRKAVVVRTAEEG
jgi:hypothetical protein